MSWWTDRLAPFESYTVASLVPSGFEAVSRVFHPGWDNSMESVSWSEVALSNGKTVHPEMQWHAIGGPEAHWGDLPFREMKIMAELLSEWTETPEQCCFAVWDGFGSSMYPSEVVAAGAGGPHARQNYLLLGRLVDIEQAWNMIDRQSPNVWWPTDRAWFLVSEIDFCWTLLAGSQELCAAVEADDRIEALRSAYSHRGTYDADTINT